jgi:hypothetical protein
MNLLKVGETAVAEVAYKGGSNSTTVSRIIPGIHQTR